MKNKKNIIKIIISLILIGFLFGYLVDYIKFIEVLQSLDVLYFITGIIFLFISVLLSSLRWKYLLSIRGVKIKYLRAFKEYLIGLFFNNFLPSSVGGDVSRMIGAANATGNKEVAVSSVLVERIIGLVALLIIGIIGFIFMDNLQNTSFLFLALILLFFVLIVFYMLLNKNTNHKMTAFIEKIIKRKFKYLSDFRDYSVSSYKLLIVLIISFAFRIVEGFFVYFIILSVGMDLGYVHAIVFFAIIGIIKMVPIAPNGLGLSAVSWVYLLGMMSVNSEMSASLDFLIITASMFVSSIGGLLWMLSDDRKNREIKKGI